MIGDIYHPGPLWGLNAIFVTTQHRCGTPIFKSACWNFGLLFFARYFHRRLAFFGKPWGIVEILAA